MIRLSNPFPTSCLILLFTDAGMEDSLLSPEIQLTACSALFASPRNPPDSLSLIVPSHRYTSCINFVLSITYLSKLNWDPDFVIHIDFWPGDSTSEKSVLRLNGIKPKTNRHGQAIAATT